MRYQVILPTFNASRWFENALASVVGHRDGEILVIDDGSQDDEREQIALICNRYQGVRFIRGQRRGLAETLNFGLSIATTPFIARMDADDISLPSRFEKQLAYLDANPNIPLVGGQMIGIDSEGKPNGKKAHFPTSPNDIASYLDKGKNPFLHPSVMMRREVVIAAGGYRAATEFAEDYDLWLRLAERYPLANLSEPIVCYRRHNGQITRSTNWQQKFARDLATLSAHCRRRLDQDPLEGLEQKISLLDECSDYQTDVMHLIEAYKALSADTKKHTVSTDTIRWILSGINSGLMGRSSKPQAKAAAQAAKLAWKDSHILLALQAIGKGIKRNPLACITGLIS